MSLLLDALNKADKERKRNQNTPSINSRHDQVAEPTSSLRWIILGVVLLTISVAAITSYILLSTSRTSTQTDTTASLKAINESNQVTPSTNVTQSPSLNAPAINSSSNQDSTNNKNSVTTNKVESSQKIADLYQQSNQNQLANQTSQTTQTQISSGEKFSAPSATSNTPNSLNQFANIPELHDLPDTVLVKIPSMKYTEHHFNKLSQSEQGGSVMINGSLKHVNDQLVNGVYLDKILEDGIVLHFENYAFKMRALNSWVNM